MSVIVCCDADCENVMRVMVVVFQAEDGIRYLVRSRGLGDVYKRQDDHGRAHARTDGEMHSGALVVGVRSGQDRHDRSPVSYTHLTLPTSDLV
mgnify:CR=1 FL=1